MEKQDLLALDRYRVQIQDLTESAGEGVNEKILALSDKIDKIFRRNLIPIEERLKFYQEARNLSRQQAVQNTVGNS